MSGPNSELGKWGETIVNVGMDLIDGGNRTSSKSNSSSKDSDKGKDNDDDDYSTWDDDD